MQENLQLNDSKKISRRFETDANWGSQSKYKGLYIFIYIYIYIYICSKRKIRITGERTRIDPN